MALLLHELRRARTSLIVWTLAIGGMIFLSMMLFPEMKKQVAEMDAMFSSMGSFTQAFGLDKVSMGESLGFYAIEAGNIISIGCGFFAALIGINALASEEKNRTAEFLLTHPISRRYVIGTKLAALVIQLIILNIVIIAISYSSFLIIDEPMTWQPFLLLHAAFFIMQFHIAAYCFCISAFLSKGSLGIGLGLTAVFYFLSIIANISTGLEELKWLTPFSYADATTIISTETLHISLVSTGVILSLVAIVIAFVRYTTKDIAS